MSFWCFCLAFSQRSTLPVKSMVMVVNATKLAFVDGSFWAGSHPLQSHNKPVLAGWQICRRHMAGIKGCPVRQPDQTTQCSRGDEERGEVEIHLCQNPVLVILSDFQYRQEGILRNLHFAYLFHSTFAGLLFFQQLSFSGDITAIALRQYVLSHRLDG